MEFDLIERIRARASARAEVLLGIGDDAALVIPPPGRALAVSSDVLNAGIHFPADTAPADIGWKALAVNLSDLAAMGAEPAVCTLALSLPRADVDWLDGFLDGFFALADQHALALVGGDTTRGSLSIAVTVHGWVDARAALRRDAARAGDDIWVTGTLGDAAAALDLWQRGAPVPAALRARLDRPEPRIRAGLALADLAHACIDVSDGLIADLGHLCRASALAADIHLAQLPVSAALAALIAAPARWQHQASSGNDTERFAFTAASAPARWRWQTGGGDDYELCFTAAPADRDTIRARMDAIGLPATRIGSIYAAAAPCVRALDQHATPWQPERAGFVHFKT